MLAAVAVGRAQMPARARARRQPGRRRSAGFENQPGATRQSGEAALLLGQSALRARRVPARGRRVRARGARASIPSLKDEARYWARPVVARAARAQLGARAARGGRGVDLAASDASPSSAWRWRGSRPSVPSRRCEALRCRRSTAMIPAKPAPAALERVVAIADAAASARGRAGARVERLLAPVPARAWRPPARVGRVARRARRARRLGEAGIDVEIGVLHR